MLLMSGREGYMAAIIGDAIKAENIYTTKCRCFGIATGL